MRIDSILNYGFLGLIVLVIGAFAGGYRAGSRSEDPARKGQRLAGILFTGIFVLVLLTWPLATKIGPLVTWEVLLVAFALGQSTIGGFWSGALGKVKRPGAPGIRIGVMTAVVVTLLLSAVYTLNGRIAVVAQQLGLNSGKNYDPATNKACSENLKSLYVAFTLYSQDWDALPPAANWLDNDDLTSKVRHDEWLHCPAVSNRHDAKYGYAYNDLVAGHKLNGKKLADLPNAAKTPLLYDSSSLAKNAHDSVTSLPKPGRHGGRNNILYCDGHVEAIAPK